MKPPKPTSSVPFALPGTQSCDPISGLCIIVPDEAPPSASGNGNLVLTRSQFAAALTTWRRIDPAARTVPRSERVNALLLLALRSAIQEPW